MYFGHSWPSTGCSKQFTVQTISSLSDLDYNSSLVFCVHHSTCSKLQFFMCDILYSVLFHLIMQLWILTKNHMIFKLWSDLETLLMAFVFLFSPPWRRPHERPKHVGDHFAIKLYPPQWNALVGLLICSYVPFHYLLITWSNRNQFDIQRTVHWKPTRCTISPIYLIKYSTCFGQVHCPPSGLSQHCIHSNRYLSC